MKQVLIKSVRVKMPRDLKLIGGKARCSLWMGPDGIVHRMVELVQVNPWNLEESPIEIDVFVKIDYWAQLKDWLDRAKAWKLDQDFEKDLKEWTRGFKRAGGVLDEVKVI